MKKSIALAFLCALNLTGWSETELEKAILEKEQAFLSATKTADLNHLQAVMGEDAVSVWPDGTVLDKEGHKKNWKDGVFRVTRIETSGLKVRTFNEDTAIVTGRVEYEGTYEGKKIDTPRIFTHVWVKQGADWQLVSRHLTFVKK
jgi:ketosteroid isomerase-like protein